MLLDEKSLRLTGLIALLFLDSFASGVCLLPRSSILPAVVHLGIQRKAVTDVVRRDQWRWRRSISETLDNEQALYFANLTIGTPPQRVRLHIDTGSSDMWVNTPTSQICKFPREPCTLGGTYNANSSTTYAYVQSDFNISYVDGSGATGDYVKDNVDFGNTTLKMLQFGVGYQSTTPEGILGIGYMANEGWVNRAGKEAYSNMPQAMVDQGYIKSNAYSLWLDDLQASTGSILFGGVDSSKYRGSLLSLPIQKEQNTYAEFIITLSDMALLQSTGSTSLKTGLPSPVILDTGSSLTYLPSDVLSPIYSSLGVQYSSRQGAGYVDCSLANENINLTFTFTSITITVPISELVIDPGNADTGNGQTFPGQSQLCLFGITYSQSSTPVLGDTFLRSAYVVFDLTNNEISLAQTNFDAMSANILEIGTGTESVPNASAIASPIEAQVSQTGGSRISAASATGVTHSGGVHLQEAPWMLVLFLNIAFVIHHHLYSA